MDVKAVLLLTGHGADAHLSGSDDSNWGWVTFMCNSYKYHTRDEVLILMA